MRLIDTHAHIGFPEFDLNRADVIARAAEDGIDIINCSLSQECWNKTKGFKGLYHSIGCTPYRLEDFGSQYQLIIENSKKLVAIGEIGLDYYWVKEKDGRKKEAENFLKFLELAKELNKPVIIHSRNAEKPVLDILEAQKMEKVAMHCFSGTMDEALRAIDLGYLISLPTNIVLSRQKQEFARKLPLESLLLETDAPYLSPEPGKINESANLVHSARKIAELRGVDFNEVAKATTKTAKGFFGI